MANPYLPTAGVQTELIEFVSGGKSVQGVVFSSDGQTPRSDTAVIFVHGVEHFWFLGPTMFLAPALAARGFTTLAYNGAHSGLTFRFSAFDTAVREVGDAISFIKARGFARVILLGHSLGTPIIEYYAGTDPDPAMMGIGLYGPHIDLPGVTRNSLLGPELYERFRAECLSLVAAGKERELRMLPYRPPATIITSAGTFLSYRDVDTSKADVRSILNKITVPMLVVYDNADNIHGLGATTHRSDIVSQLTSAAKNFEAIEAAVVPSTAGNSPAQAHSFVGAEQFVIELTHRWVTRVVG